MKYMIASDIHGSAYYCRKLLEAFEEEKADKLLLLGDLLYHGPRNDLPEEYDPKEVAAQLNKYKDKIVCVRGNCDSEVDQMMLEFPIMADYCVLSEGKQTIYATHGHHYNIDSPLPMQKGDALLYGHFHVPMDEERNGIRFLNPGSVSIPKEDSWHGYIVLENEKFLWKDFDGQVRM